MLDHDAGLHPSDNERGRWYYQYINRIEALVEALRVAGFAVHGRPLGPRGGRRWVLDLSDYDEVRGLAYFRCELYRPWEWSNRPEDCRWEAANLLARSLCEEQFDIVARLRRVPLANRREQFTVTQCIKLAKIGSTAVLENIDKLAENWWGTTQALIVTAEAVTRAAAREPKPTPAQRRELDDAGISIEAYVHERKAGMKHRGILGAYRVGATHRQLIQAHRAGMNITTYTNGRKNGIAHGGLIAAHKSGLDIDCFVKARKAGATQESILRAHETGATGRQILEAHKAGVNLSNYALWRYHWYSHEDVLAALTIGAHIHEYTVSLENGATRGEFMAARDGGVDMTTYARLRAINATHEEALLLSSIPQVNACVTTWNQFTDAPAIELALAALRCLHADGPATPAELDIIGGMTRDWGQGPTDLAEAARSIPLGVEQTVGRSSDGQGALEALAQRAFDSGGHHRTISHSALGGEAPL